MNPRRDAEWLEKEIFAMAKKDGLEFEAQLDTPVKATRRDVYTIAVTSYYDGYDTGHAKGVVSSVTKKSFLVALACSLAGYAVAYGMLYVVQKVFSCGW